MSGILSDRLLCRTQTHTYLYIYIYTQRQWHKRRRQAEILPYAAYEQCVILNTFMRNILDLFVFAPLFHSLFAFFTVSIACKLHRRI